DLTTAFYPPTTHTSKKKRKTVRKEREHNKLSVKCALSRTSWKAVLVGCCFVVVSLLFRCWSERIWPCLVCFALLSFFSPLLHFLTRRSNYGRLLPNALSSF